jgi:hypothetical protein
MQDAADRKLVKVNKTLRDWWESTSLEVMTLTAHALACATLNSPNPKLLRAAEGARFKWWLEKDIRVEILEVHIEQKYS